LRQCHGGAVRPAASVIGNRGEDDDHPAEKSDYKNEHCDEKLNQAKSALSIPS
jgi:hypothetical protein